MLTRRPYLFFDDDQPLVALRTTVGTPTVWTLLGARGFGLFDDETPPQAGPFGVPPPPPRRLSDPVGTVVDVHAVLDDGSRRAPGVPLDTRRPLRFVAGVDTVLMVSLTAPDGHPVSLDLAGGDSLTFVVRDSASSSPRLAVAAVRQASLRPGRYVATVAAGALRQIAGQRVQWLMTAVRGGKTFRVVGASEFYVAW